VTAGPEWVPFPRWVEGRDAAAPCEALRRDAVVAIIQGSTRPLCFMVLPSSPFSTAGKNDISNATRFFKFSQK
jgi:hypothetical protein